MEIKEIINRIIRDRRAVYPVMYTGERVDDTLIKDILENANWAPTHRKTEPWRFIVYTGEALKMLSDHSAEWYRKHTPSSDFSEFKYKKTKEKALKSSHVMAVIMKRHESMVPEWEEIAAVACAVQNMWLSCSAYGLGSYWSTPKYATEGNDFFKLQENERCLGLFYIGIPQPGLQLKGEREPVENKVRWAKPGKFGTI